MRGADIKVGGRYFVRVGESRVAVEVTRTKVDASNRTRYVVRRVDNGRELPKARHPSALHP